MSIEKFIRKELLKFPKRQRRRPKISGLINLGSGDPDFNQPKFIIDAVVKAMEDGWTHYEPSGGDMELKIAISDYYNKYGIKVDPETQVWAISGSSPGMFLALATIINPDEEVILLDPTYDGGYRKPLDFLGGKIVKANMHKDKNGYFRPDLENIENAISDKTKAIVLCNPDNPTGCVFTQDELEVIAELAIEHDFMVVTDEVYNEFIWGDRKYSTIISLPSMMERTIVVSSFSKTFAWTGIRGGFLLSCPEIIDFFRLNPFRAHMAYPFQKALVVALKEGWVWVNEMREIYKRRVDYCVNRLNNMYDISCVYPESSFYVFPDISSTGMKSAKFCKAMLDYGKLRIVPGSSYGEQGEGHIRIALVRPMDILKEAMDRFERTVKRLSN